MSSKEEKSRRFLTALVDELSSQVLEDEAACDEALALGSDAELVVVRVRQAASRAIAEQRRTRIATLWQPRSETTRGRYKAMSRAELVSLIEKREAAVEHRDLSAAPDEDLRTLLEDLDAVEEDSGPKE